MCNHRKCLHHVHKLHPMSVYFSLSLQLFGWITNCLSVGGCGAANNQDTILVSIVLKRLKSFFLDLVDSAMKVLFWKLNDKIKATVIWIWNSYKIWILWKIDFNRIMNERLMYDWCTTWKLTFLWTNINRNSEHAHTAVFSFLGLDNTL